METIKNSRIPITVLYILLFLAGGLSRNLHGAPTSSLSAFIYIFMVAVWFHDVRKRVLEDSVTHTVSAICSFCFFLLIARTIKYSLADEVSYLETFTWYFPSIGVIQIATLLFILAGEIGEGGQKGFKKIFLIEIPGIIITFLMLTNDFHQLAYRFTPDGDYTYGILYYIYVGWSGILFIASLIIMYRKCSVSPGRKYIWVPFALLLASALALGLIVAILDRIAYRPVIRYSWYEIFILMVIVYIESCLAIGLIPSRTGFDTLFKLSSVAVEIKDTQGNTVIRSSSELGESDDENIIRKHAAIPGGYIYWNDDITDINRITETILNSASELSEEQDLIQAEKKLLDIGEKYSLKVALYDDITRAVEPQSRNIERLLEQDDPDFSELVVYGVFIKRNANLMIISADNDTISLGELYLSLKDALEYLKYRGINTSLTINGTDEDLLVCVPSSVVISLFDGYERYVEENLNRLKSLKISIAPGNRPQLHIDAVQGKEEVSYVLS